MQKLKTAFYIAHLGCESLEGVISVCEGHMVGVKNLSVSVLNPGVYCVFMCLWSGDLFQ